MYYHQEDQRKSKCRLIEVIKELHSSIPFWHIHTNTYVYTDMHTHIYIHTSTCILVTPHFQHSTDTNKDTTQQIMSPTDHRLEHKLQESKSLSAFNGA